MALCDDLLNPSRLWTRSEVINRPSPVPKAPGVYAWYFRSIDSIPASSCHVCGDFRLLYIGIAPSAPPTNGKQASSQNLRNRIRCHMTGNSEGSTLRLSLGCVLAEQLSIQLRRVGNGNRMTFSTGEERLSRWMEENARVAWAVCDQPWELEEELVAALDLPLNLDMNSANVFYPALTELRRNAKLRAMALPIVVR